MADNVIFVTHSAQVAGGELSLLDIILSCPGKCELLVLEYGPFVELAKSAGVSVRVVDFKFSEKMPLVARLFSLVVNVGKLFPVLHRAGLVYVNSQKSALLCGVLRMFSLKKVVWHVRDIVDSSHFNSLKLALISFNLKFNVSLAVCNSQATLRSVEALGGSGRLLYNAIDVERISNSPAFPFSKEGVNVCLVGRLAEWKGQYIAIEAVKGLPGVNLYLVGGALFGEEEYVERLKKLIKDYRLETRVVFVGHVDDPVPYMKAADILIHSSVLPEPFGRVVVEGMASGTPIVATAGGGVLEIVEHGVNGLLVPMGDVKEMRMAISRLIEDKEFASQLSRQAFKDVLSKFSLPILKRNVVAVLKEII